MMNKVVLITGGACGIGRAIALELAKNHYDIVINYLTSRQAAEALKEQIIHEYGVRCLAVWADISDADQVDRMAAEIEEKLGGIDILINNAAVDLSNLFHLKNAEEFRRTLDVNVVGAFNCSKRVYPHMLEQEYGRIINITSQLSVVANENESVYCASKGAINNLTRALSYEWSKQGVIVSAVAPTFTYTPGTAERLDTPAFRDSVLARIPRGRLGEISDIGAAVQYLASDHADMASGAVLFIDGGWTIV